MSRCTRCLALQPHGSAVDPCTRLRLSKKRLPAGRVASRVPDSGEGQWECEWPANRGQRLNRRRGRQIKNNTETQSDILSPRFACVFASVACVVSACSACVNILSLQRWLLLDVCGTDDNHSVTGPLDALQRDQRDQPGRPSRLHTPRDLDGPRPKRRQP